MVTTSNQYQDFLEQERLQREVFDRSRPLQEREEGLKRLILLREKLGLSNVVTLEWGWNMPKLQTKTAPYHRELELVANEIAMRSKFARN